MEVGIANVSLKLTLPKIRSLLNCKFGLHLFGVDGFCVYPASVRSYDPGQQATNLPSKNV